MEAVAFELGQQVSNLDNQPIGIRACDQAVAGVIAFGRIRSMQQPQPELHIIGVPSNAHNTIARVVSLVAQRRAWSFLPVKITHLSARPHANSAALCKTPLRTSTTPTR